MVSWVWPYDFYGEFGDFCMDFHISCRVLLMRWVVNRLRWWRMDFNVLKGSVKILFNLGEFGIFNSSQTLRQILCKHFRFDCKLTPKVNIHPEKATKVTFTWTISRQLWRILSLHPIPHRHPTHFNFADWTPFVCAFTTVLVLFAYNTGDYKVLELWYGCQLLANMISYVFFHSKIWKIFPICRTPGLTLPTKSLRCFHPCVSCPNMEHYLGKL